MLNNEKASSIDKGEKRSVTLQSMVLPQKLELSLGAITSLFTEIYFFLGSAAGFVIFNSDLGIERYGIILAVAVIPLMGAFVPEKISPLKLYLKSLSALNFIFLVILSSGNLPLLMLSFVPAGIAMVSLVSGERYVRRKNSRLAVFVGVFLFMLYIGEFVTIASGSLSNNIIFIPSVDFFLTSSFSRVLLFLYAGVVVLSPDTSDTVAMPAGTKLSISMGRLPELSITRKMKFNAESDFRYSFRGESFSGMNAPIRGITATARIIP